MLFRQEGKQLWRTPLRTLALCLALAVVTGLFAIAHGLLQASAHMREQVDANYTTVAYVPSRPGIYYNTGNKPQSSTNELFKAIKKGEFQSQVALSIDEHSRIAAYDPSLTPLISGSYVDSTYDHDLNFPYNIGVFAATCTDKLFSRTETQFRREEIDGEIISIREKVDVYYYVFEVEKVISLREDIAPPTKLVVTSEYYNAGNTISFVEPGSSYLLWGFYDEKAEQQGELFTYLDYESSVTYDDILWGLWDSHGMVYFHFPLGQNSNQEPCNTLPLLAKYNGDPEAYLANDPTGYWDNLMKIVDISRTTVHVLSADHPYALRAFIDERSQLMEGSFFTEAELESGAKVAMVSDLLAEANGIKVGDTLDLSFYWTYYGDTRTGTTYHRDEMQAPNRLWGYTTLQYEEFLAKYHEKTNIAAEDGIYTVVGIYSVDAWANDADNIHPNTVIVPQAALTHSYPLNVTQFDRTFILPNGGIDAFEAELEEAGFGGMVHYYDQGYSSIIPGVEAICHSAEFVYNIVRVLWILSVIMILLIFIWTQMPSGLVKYRLGAGKVRIWAQMSFSALMVMIISCLGGFAGSVLLYDCALNWMMQADFTSFNTTFSTISANADMLGDLLGMMGQTPDVFAKMCIVQFVILFLLAVIFAAVASLRKKSFKQ